MNDDSYPKSPKKAWLFDFDGVLANPQSKVIEIKTIFDEIAQRLRKGEPVGINTGRSIQTIEERLIDPLLLHDYSVAHSPFYVVAEKGTVSLQFAADGTRTKATDLATSSADVRTLRNHVATLAGTKYPDVLFFDSTKEVSITLEMKNGFDLDIFRQIQCTVVSELESLLLVSNLVGLFQIDATRIAIDIDPVHASKALGARKFMRFLDSYSIEPSEFLTFGDSPSDFDMANELHKSGHAVRFIYVANPEDMSNLENNLVPIDYTRRKFDSGTHDYLSCFEVR